MSDSEKLLTRIAITSGDVAGIGPEVVLKATRRYLSKHSAIFILLGSADYYKRYFPDFYFDAIVTDEGEIPAISRSGVYLLDFDNIDFSSFEFGTVRASNGRAAGEYIEYAVQLALRKEVDAIVTAPINKEAFNLGGYKYPGHTEFLATLCGVSSPVMLMYGSRLSTALVTIHEPLKRVPELLTKERVFDVIMKVHSFYETHIKTPKIAVCGLNPHASENGLFGNEEELKILPAIEAAAAQGVKVSGPYPADTIFFYAYKGEFDVVIAQFHDQGLIPFKLVHFNDGVNVTVGLPIIRTSPDHGTAFNIAGQNKADDSSMYAALQAAVEFAKKRNR